MIIHCEECGKKSKVDDNKITKARMRASCPHCKNLIIIVNPIENEPVMATKSSFVQDATPSDSGQLDTEWEVEQVAAPQTKKATGMTIGKKMMILFLFFILATGSILTVVYMKYVPTLMYDQVNLRTYSISQALSSAIQQPLLIKNYLQVNKTAQTNAQLPGVAYVSVMNKRGIVVAGILGDNSRYDPQFIQRVKKSGFPKEISTQNGIPTGQEESALDYSVGGVKIHDVAVKIGDSGGEAHVGLFVDDVEKSVQKSLIPLLVLLAVIAIIGCLSFFLVARTISNPIKSLTQAAEKISMGELDLKITTKGSGEIRDLADSLERMRVSISMAMKKLRQN